jgi:hypothetical protein
MIAGAMRDAIHVMTAGKKTLMEALLGAQN